MASRSSAIITDIVDHLNAQEWPDATFAAKRVVREQAWQESLTSPICYVYPGTIQYAEATREVYDFTHEIGFEIVKAMTQETLAEQDSVIEIVEQLPQRLLNRTMSDAKMLSVAEESSQALFDIQSVDAGALYVAMTSVFYLDTVTIERA